MNSAWKRIVSQCSCQSNDHKSLMPFLVKVLCDPLFLFYISKFLCQFLLCCFKSYSFCNSPMAISFLLGSVSATGNIKYWDIVFIFLTQMCFSFFLSVTRSTFSQQEAALFSQVRTNLLITSLPHHEVTTCMCEWLITDQASMAEFSYHCSIWPQYSASQLSHFIHSVVNHKILHAPVIFRQAWTGTSDVTQWHWMFYRVYPLTICLELRKVHLTYIQWRFYGTV